MNGLREIIEKEISGPGKITFRRFMELALYHQHFGYYTSGKVEIGRAGDFYTSPYVHRAFGYILSKFFLKCLKTNNTRKPFLVEVGSGKGILAKDILDKIETLDKTMYNELTYIFIEKSPSLINEAKSRLKKHGSKIVYQSDISDIAKDSVEGIVFSNELYDSIPFHRIVVNNGKLEEIFVTIDSNNFIEITGPLSTGEIERYLEDYKLSLIEGQAFEVNLSAAAEFKNISDIISKGFLLTIDYGYLAEELYNSSRMRGTYKCIKHHTINEEPYSYIGEQDITAHVDFSKLISLGEKLGLEKVIYTTQGQFLVDWGILEILDELSLNQGERYEREISAIKNLFLPGSMGNSFKALLQQKGIKTDISSFYPESPFKISFDVV